MGGFFGGGGVQNINNSEPMALGVRVQTSAYGLAQPIVYGTNRLNGNLIWYGAFTAIPHTTTTSGGGGGGKGGGGGGSTYSQTNYTYTASFMFALCEGTIQDIGAVWADKDYYAANPFFTVFSGGSQLVDKTYAMTNSGSTVSTSLTVANSYIEVNWTPAYTGGAEAATYVLSRSVGGGAYVDIETITFGYEPYYSYYDWNGDDWMLVEGGYSNTQYKKQFSGLTLGAYSWKITKASGTGSALFGNCSVVDHVASGATQNAWSYLTSNFASQALNYRGTAYAAVANFDLGAVTTIPNFSFEVQGILGQYGNGDASACDVLYNFLTDTSYGAGFPASKIANWSQYNAYILAQNLIISPIFDSQIPASEAVTDIMQITNCGIYFSEGLLKVTPYGDQQMTANGVTYYPNNIPVYDIGDSEYIANGDDDPVQVRRVPQADAFNQIQIEFVNRENQYNVQISEAKDQGSIEAYGLRPKDPIRAHHIADPTVARTVAQLMLQRSLYIRNTYRFRVGAKFALLEPTDYITISDKTLGLVNTPVRITSIEEDSDYTYLIEAEDAPAGVRNAALYSSEPADGHQNEYNVSGGNTNTPVIFEAPYALAATGLEIWAAASGGSLWGGCQVWASYDGSSYQQIGYITNPSRMGVLTAALATGSDPDTSHTLAVNLSSSRGELSSGTQADADSLATLCYVDGEWVSYQTATLTSQYNYNLTYLRRGAYYSTIANHPIGANFVRIDSGILRYPFDAAKIGKTIYLKFPSYNIYNGGLQSLDSVNAVTYTIQGTATKTPPSNVSAVTATFANNLTNATCTLSWSNPDLPLGLAAYNITWAGGSFRANTNTATIPVDWTGTRSFTIVTIDPYGNQSTGYTFTVTKSAPPNVTGVATTASNGSLVLTWNQMTKTSLPIVNYEVRTSDSNWGGTGALYVGTAFSINVTPAASGSSTTWYVRAVDAAGQYSAASGSATYVTSLPPNIIDITAEFTSSSLTNSTVTIRWADVAPPFGLSNYIVSYGSTSMTVKGNAVTLPADWVGNRTFSVKTVDNYGNQSSGYSEAVTKLAPLSPSNLTSQIIDNNVMLYWTLPAQTTLPIDHAVIKRGSTYATATVVGTKSGTFTTVNETKAGVYTYWVAAVDTDGVEGNPISVTATVAQPPDFIYTGQFISTFTGTATNAIVESGALIMCVNTTETYASHFTTNSWSTPQDQINAGYPIYIQPGLTTGTYVEVFDYGTVLASSNVVLTVGASTVAGSITFVPTISVSLNGTTYTDYQGSTNVFATNFRYVKITLTATQVAAGALYKINGLTVDLNSKQIYDQNVMGAVSTDTLGTIVNFNKEFVDVGSITLSAQGTAPRTCVYDFRDSVVNGTYTVSGGVCTVTATAHSLITGQNVRLSFLSGTAITGVYTITGYTTNTFTVAMSGTTSGNVGTYPNSMRVYVFDNSGTRQSGTVSWQISGY